MQTQALGKEGAEAALRILKGEKPRTINTPHVYFGPAVYDARELRRWDISELRLPAGSIVQFREATVWQQYRWQIITIVATVLAQAAVITGLFLERRRRQIAEAQLRDRLLEVIHLNRTAVAGSLSASIAHELNQPLGAIQSYAEAAMLYLSAEPPNVERAEQILSNILRDNDRAAQIISHLRGLLKKKTGDELEQIDLNEVVEDTLQIVGPEALKKGIELVATAPTNRFVVRGDRIYLQQVILNLAMNAIDAMQNCKPGDGKLSVKVALLGNTVVEVWVEDSGMGISARQVGQDL